MANALAVVLNENEARVNITWQGQNYDLQNPMLIDSTDEQIRASVTETVRFGIEGLIPADPNADFTNYVINRFAPTEARPWNAIFVRPKVPFGLDDPNALVPLAGH